MEILVPTERKIFCRFKLWNTNTGDLRDKETDISLMVAGGADAVRAITGAFVRLRNSPSLL